MRPQEHVVLLTGSTTRENWDSLKKKSGVPKCCACIARPTVATIEKVTSTNSVARDSLKELWNIKVLKSVRRGSQRYFDQQRVSNNET